MLCSRNIIVRRGDNEFEFPDIKIDCGELYGVFGASGVGKTTLLLSLAGLLPLKLGEIEFENEVFQSENKRADKKQILFNTHYISADLKLPTQLSIEQYFGVLAEVRAKKFDKLQALETLGSIGLEKNLKTKIGQLSQGEKQRIAIAGALMCRPKIIFADEPTSALDDESTSKILRILSESAKSGHSFIIATHDMRLKPIMSNMVILS